MQIFFGAKKEMCNLLLHISCVTRDGILSDNMASKNPARLSCTRHVERHFIMVTYELSIWRESFIRLLPPLHFWRFKHQHINVKCWLLQLASSGCSDGIENRINMREAWLTRNDIRTKIKSEWSIYVNLLKLLQQTVTVINI